MIQTNYNASFVNTLRKNLRKEDGSGQAAKKLGQRLKNAEKNYLNITSKDGATEGYILAAKIKYERSVRVFEGFSQMMRNSFQIMMQGIRSLSIR